MLIIFLVGVFLTAMVWSCRTGAPDISSSNEEEEEEKEEPSPDVDEVDLDDVDEPPLNRAETILRDKVATQVCINNSAIKSALADMTCRIKEQLSWLTHSQLYMNTAKNECYTRAKSLEKKFGLNSTATPRTDDSSSDGSVWLEASCKKLAGQGLVDLDYRKRRENGNPVTESELRNKLEEILGDKNYEDLKQGQSTTTHLEGLLKFNTYGLNEKCSAELRYDSVRAISRSNFKVKPLLMTAHALSEPVSDFIEQFRGIKAPANATSSDLPFGGDLITVAGKNSTDIIGTYWKDKPSAGVYATISNVTASGTTTTVTKTATIDAIINHTYVWGGPDLPSSGGNITGIRKITIKDTNSETHYCIGLTDGGNYGTPGTPGILNNRGVVMDEIVPNSEFGDDWKVSAVTILSVSPGAITIKEDKAHDHCHDNTGWDTTKASTVKNVLIANTTILKRVDSLTHKEKDFFLINWPKLRNSFADLPDGVRGEFDYLHFYKRNSSGTRTSTVQENVLQTVRVLKATCGKSASNQRAYLRADTRYMNSKAESPQASFFSRTQFDINVSPFTSTSPRCQMRKVNRNFEGSESRYTPIDNESLDPDFMCASNGVGYLCYERDPRTHADTVLAKMTCNKPPIYDGSKYFLRRGRHCMCADPSDTSTIDQYKSDGSDLGNSDETILNTLCGDSKELYKDIKLEGDAGDLKDFGETSQTLMEYLVTNHAEDIVRRSTQNDGECIAGLDYIDLCEDANFNNHPDVSKLKTAYCPNN